MTPLFTDLSPADSGAIVKDLERQGIAFELKADGGAVLSRIAPSARPGMTA